MDDKESVKNNNIFKLISITIVSNPSFTKLNVLILSLTYTLYIEFTAYFRLFLSNRLPSVGYILIFL